MRTISIILIAFLALCAGCEEQNSETNQARPSAESANSDLPPPGRPVVGSKPPMPDPVQVSNPSGYRTETFVSNLTIPWDMAFVSMDRIYITERPGRVRLIENGRLQSEPYATINNVRAAGEGGLMGIALHPRYPNPRWVYLMYTYSAEGRTYNRISRFTDTGTGLSDETPVVTRIPGGFVHDGGVIRFGPDGMLYAGTGETGEPELAQDISSLAGKILRMTPEGKPPDDNPFDNSIVYAYGFRNVQGLAWNPENGDLWATNHGPTGEFGLQAKDSVFIVQKGGNHGWPRVLGVTDIQDVVPPVLFFPDTSEPPGRTIFYNGSLMPDLRGDFFYTTLRGEHLARVVLSGSRQINGIEYWWQTGTQQGTYGRLRTVAQGPDGAIYVSTSNRDGRASPRSGDDRILRVSPR